MFGFLPSDSGSESLLASTNGLSNGKFADLPARSASVDSRGSMLPTDSRVFPDENEDLRDFQFGKFAATYFQGQATAGHSRKPLRYPLLPHDNTGDQIVRYYFSSKNLSRKIRQKFLGDGGGTYIVSIT